MKDEDRLNLICFIGGVTVGLIFGFFAGAGWFVWMVS